LGVHLVAWTFDPLESLNGYFNISKLGAICNRYKRNYHGRMGGINAGLPSDRFYVEWWVTSNRVQGRLSPSRGSLSFQAFLDGGAVLVNESKLDANGLLVSSTSFTESNKSIILVEIPDNFQLLKRQNLNLAMDWRMHTRHLFEHYFERGYECTPGIFLSTISREATW
jgi:predicted GNAT superfamily acetyltransferase